MQSVQRSQDQGCARQDLYTRQSAPVAFDDAMRESKPNIVLKRSTGRRTRTGHACGDCMCRVAR
eukprot:2807495-Prymnesium_polylepis.2